MQKRTLSRYVDIWSARFTRTRRLALCAAVLLGLGLSLTGEGAEPSERYRRVNWVENYDTSAALPGATNNWASIDTGVKPAWNLGVCVDYEYKCFAQAGSYMVGALDGAVRHYYVSVNNKNQWRGANGEIMTCTSLAGPDVNKRYEVTTQSRSDKKLEITVRSGAETVGSAMIDGTATTLGKVSFGLFSNHSTGTSFSYPSYARLYSCELWTTNGAGEKTVLRDFVPCFDTTGKKFGVYDRQHGKFYSASNNTSRLFYGPLAPVPSSAQFVYDGQPHGISVPEHEGYTIEPGSVVSAIEKGS